jgi:tetratricopeptide (TPR) repeat protein
MHRMSQRPPWLHPRRSASITEEVLEELCQRLESGATRWIHGPPGSGRTQVLAAVATRLHRPLVAVRLAGCRDEQDVILGLGWALKSIPQGSKEAVIDAARNLERPCFIIDDADVSGLDSLLEDLLAAIPDSSWLCAGSREPPSSLADEPIILSGGPLPELPGDLDVSATSTGSLHPALLLASLPAGLPNLGELPADLLLVDTSERQVMRPTMIEVLRSRLPAPSQVASELVRVYDQTLSLAHGAPITEAHRWEDALTLRWMGEVLADPDLACFASATASRLLVAWGQQVSAGQVLEAAKRRNTQARPRGLAILAWAEADRSLSFGDLDSADKHFENAKRILHNEGEDAILARLNQRRADAHIQRRQFSVGTRYLRTARRLLTVIGDSPGISSTLRSAADLAVSNGEVLSAETLYDQAAGSELPPIESIARKIGVAGLALSRGDHPLAKRMLEQLSDPHNSVILTGNLLRRQADLALREGRTEQAESLAGRALWAYARGGSHVAIGHTRYLLGDIAAIQGAISTAWKHYWNAIDVQLHVHDYSGLVRTLERVQMLERAGGRSDHADQILEAIVEIQKDLAS